MSGHIGEPLDCSPSCFLIIPTKFGRATKRKQNIWSTSQGKERRKIDVFLQSNTTHGPSRHGKPCILF